MLSQGWFGLLLIDARSEKQVLDILKTLRVYDVVIRVGD